MTEAQLRHVTGYLVCTCGVEASVVFRWGRVRCVSCGAIYEVGLVLVLVEAPKKGGEAR